MESGEGKDGGGEDEKEAERRGRGVNWWERRGDLSEEGRREEDEGDIREDKKVGGGVREREREREEEREEESGGEKEERS